jgi:hypothetical protein
MNTIESLKTTAIQQPQPGFCEGIKAFQRRDLQNDIRTKEIEFRMCHKFDDPARWGTLQKELGSCIAH